MGSEGAKTLLANPKFASTILSVVFDEGHCISQWGKFRKDYTQLGMLRHTIQATHKIPFLVASATLPKTTISEISDVLRLRDSQTEYLLHSNDRLEVAQMVRTLVYPANSFKDLGFLLPCNEGYCTTPLGKFVVFFDNIKEAEAATKFLRKRLETRNQQRVVYFHATMTQHYRLEQVEEFRKGATWGICSTDAFGMVNLVFLLVMWAQTHALVREWTYMI